MRSKDYITLFILVFELICIFSGVFITAIFSSDISQYLKIVIIIINVTIDTIIAIAFNGFISFHLKQEEGNG
jgi:hypothetical protein